MKDQFDIFTSNEYDSHYFLWKFIELHIMYSFKEDDLRILVNMPLLAMNAICEWHDMHHRLKPWSVVRLAFSR